MTASSKEFSYTAHGLTILSGIPLPELSLSMDCKPPQLSIHAGRVTRELKARTGGGALFQVAPDEFLLNLDGLARYLVRGGSGIMIDSASGTDADAVRLFLFGSVFGAVLHQRGLLPLHASAIETARGAVLFAGASGTGKSALAATFHARGYRVIADEICAIRGIATGVEAIPAIPRLLLWPDVMEKSRLSVANFRPATANLRKYNVTLEEGFAPHPVRIDAIYMLNVTNAPDFEISRVTGIDKVQQLIDLTFRRQFLSGMCRGDRHFDQVTNLSRHLRLSRFGRPSSRTLQQTADFLEKEFNR